jgi:hypothetical protein
MKTIIRTIILTLIIAVVSSISAQIKSTEYKVNTIDGPELQYWVFLETEKTELISPSFFDEPSFDKDIVIEIKDADNEDKIGEGEIDESSGGIAGNCYLIITFKKLNEKEINALVEGKKNYFLFVEKDIVIQLIDTNGQKTKIISIKPGVLKSATIGKLKLPENYVDLLIKSSGNISFLYDNYIDLGTEVGTNDSEKTSYSMKFNYHSIYSSKAKWISWQAHGRISTKDNDPLNEFALYPIYLNQIFFPEKILPAYELSLLAGLESNQKFTMQRIIVTGSIQSIIPNLIDFTGGANRLRLKPVVKIGAKGLFEYQDKRLDQSKDNDGEVIAELYYYIPVYKTYCVLIEGNAFNVFTGNNSGFGWKYKYDLTFGVEIPGTELKVIAKYSQGENDVNFIYDSQLLLGLMLDFFEKK